MANSQCVIMCLKNVECGASRLPLLMTTCLLGALSGCDLATERTQVDTVEQETPANFAELWSQLPAGSKSQLVISPPVYPSDLFLHPESVSESVHVRAVWENDNGVFVGFQSRLDRLNLGIEQTEPSAWSYSQLIRSSVALGVSGNRTLQKREGLQRMALNLASSSRTGMSEGATQLSFTASQPASSKPSSKLRPEVGAAEEQPVCTGRYQLATQLPTGALSRREAMDGPVSSPQSHSTQQQGEAPVHLQLTVDFAQCPESLSLASVNRWRFQALPAMAITSDVPLAEPPPEFSQNAYVWLSHTWGALPTMSHGAVVIDQLQLVLDPQADSKEGVMRLLASRSKRRSGRGPRPVQALITAQGSAPRELELRWVDEGTQWSDKTGQRYPQRFRLTTADESIDLEVTPLVILPEVSDPLGTQLSGMVRVSGSHRGLGFVEFRPLEKGLSMAGKP